MNDQNPHSAERLPFVRPAEYYETPERTRVLPKWLPMGCGIASIAFLIIIFITGAFLARGGSGRLLDKVFGQMQSEIDGQFTKDVSAAQRQAFDTEMNALRAQIRASRLNLDKMQPMLRTIREVSDDDKITPDEAKQLTEAVHKARGQ